MAKKGKTVLSLGRATLDWRAKESNIKNNGMAERRVRISQP